MTAALSVAGVAIWTPGFADAAAWIARARDPAVTKPEAALLPSRQRRRTSLLTRALVEVLAAAADDARLDPGATPTVFASAYGETQTMIELLAMLHDDGELSPMRFAGSVHNTASGNASIATGNRGFTTSLAAGPDTPAMALLEASALLADRGGAVLVAIGDVSPPRVLVPEAERRFETLAVGLALTAGDPGAPTLTDLAPTGAHDGVVLCDLRPPLRRNPCGGALALADAILRGAEGVVALDTRTGGGWTVTLSQGGV